MKTIGILGMGRMGKCLVRGWSASKRIEAQNVFSCVRREVPEAAVEKTLSFTRLETNNDVVKKSAVIFLCVKPQNVAEVLAEIRPALTPKHLLVSIAAGVTTGELEAWGSERDGKLRVIRAMPNTPAFVRAGITAIALGNSATEDDANAVTHLFGSLGEVVRVQEKQLDAVTGLSGCGPAYVYLMLEALTDAGIKVGLSRELALKLAAQTFLGAAKMVLETGIHPAALRDEVTTPSGCTIEGLMALEEGKLRVALVNAVVRATARSKELKKENQ